jgi:cell division protein FtsI (penicillin-binding protein 3)
LEIKKDILWRGYLVFLGMLIFSGFIIGKAAYIQQVEGDYWKSLSDSIHLQYQEMDADRGTIFSEDGSMLSSSIPFFDVRIDFGAQGLREKSGARYRKHADSLSIRLAQLFKDRSPAEYRRELDRGFKTKERYHLLKRNISFREYQEIRDFPLVRDGRNKSGFIFEDREKRLTPFGLLANRTIGLSRSYVDTRGRIINKNVGLELAYDDVLTGVRGRRLVRRISGGAYVPVEGSETEPENGKDIRTTLDINIQEIAHQALLKQLEAGEATYGTCIVMEVKTGKIKAIANLGRQPDGSYYEDLNYAITGSEPGSTFKLVTMLAVFEDGLVSPETTVDLEKGTWKVGSRTVRDSERHGRNQVTVKQAFELSSNVGMAKLAMAHYSASPMKFVDHMKKLGIHQSTGLGLKGETKSVIQTPGTRSWSASSLPWLSFGYNVKITPLHTLMLYNAVANGGKMMKPYLVNAILRDGQEIQRFGPEVLSERICSPETLEKLKSCLEGVVTEGTAKSLRSPFYTIAGKTGTAQVANGNKGYNDHIYQSSFAGYFPADNPRYACIVVIRNKPHAKTYYGSLVAGPVFREVADKIYALDVSAQPLYAAREAADSASFLWAGAGKDFRLLQNRFGLRAQDSSGKSTWAVMAATNSTPVRRMVPVTKGQMPSVQGMGLRDAIYLLENLSIKVVPVGSGRVKTQSVQPGTPVQKGQTVTLEMGAP